MQQHHLTLRNNQFEASKDKKKCIQQKEMKTSKRKKVNRALAVHDTKLSQKLQKYSHAGGIVLEIHELNKKEKKDIKLDD